MGLLPLLRMMGALGLVLGLLAGALWIVRRYDIRLPGRTGGLGRRLDLVERVALDTRRSVALIRRDGREHLVLVGPDGATIIESGIVRDEIDHAAEAQRAAERQRQQEAAAAAAAAAAAEVAAMRRRAKQAAATAVSSAAARLSGVHRQFGALVEKANGNSRPSAPAEVVSAEAALPAEPIVATPLPAPKAPRTPRTAARAPRRRKATAA